MNIENKVVWGNMYQGLMTDRRGNKICPLCKNLVYDYNGIEIRCTRCPWTKAAQRKEDHKEFVEAKQEFNG